MVFPMLLSWFKYTKSNHSNLGQNVGWRDGSMVRILVALAEDPGLDLSTHMVAHIDPNCNYRGPNALF